MALSICVYEDESFRDFHPISLLRPVCAMRAGIVPLFHRLAWSFPGARISLATRHSLASLVAAEHRDYPVNIVQRDEKSQVLFVNGRLRDLGNLPKLTADARLTTLFRNKGKTIGVLFQADVAADVPRLATPEDYQKCYLRHPDESADYETTATLYDHCWDVMADIENAVTSEFPTVVKSQPGSTNVTIHDGSHFVDKGNVFLGSGVTIMPGAVIDASHGPVFIGANTRVETHAAIFGPTYIGPNSVVVAGKISACSIGHTCRVGGEVEESVFQSYVNKYHAGFIGHSYVGSWVNFGAMTTNSDLKNNYSNIRVSLNGEETDTGSIKVGSFIGDHTKFGIGTLLNTGIVIGACCNIYGGTLITDKEVDSFSWGNSAGYQVYKFEKAMETARRTTARRSVDLSSHEEEALQSIARGDHPAGGVLTWRMPG